jgi:hypothetical protein
VKEHNGPPAITAHHPSSNIQSSIRVQLFKTKGAATMISLLLLASLALSQGTAVVSPFTRRPPSAPPRANEKGEKKKKRFFLFCVFPVFWCRAAWSTDWKARDLFRRVAIRR